MLNEKFEVKKSSERSRWSPRGIAGMLWGGIVGTVSGALGGLVAPIRGIYKKVIGQEIDTSKSHWPVSNPNPTLWDKLLGGIAAVVSLPVTLPVGVIYGAVGALQGLIYGINAGHLTFNPIIIGRTIFAIIRQPFFIRKVVYQQLEYKSLFSFHRSQVTNLVNIDKNLGGLRSGVTQAISPAAENVSEKSRQSQAQSKSHERESIGFPRSSRSSTTHSLRFSAIEHPHEVWAEPVEVRGIIICDFDQCLTDHTFHTFSPNYYRNLRNIDGNQDVEIYSIQEIEAYFKKSSRDEIKVHCQNLIKAAAQNVRESKVLFETAIKNNQVIYINSFNPGFKYLGGHGMKLDPPHDTMDGKQFIQAVFDEAFKDESDSFKAALKRRLKIHAELPQVKNRGLQAASSLKELRQELQSNSGRFISMTAEQFNALPVIAFDDHLANLTDPNEGILTNSDFSTHPKVAVHSTIPDIPPAHPLDIFYKTDPVDDPDDYKKGGPPGHSLASHLTKNAEFRGKLQTLLEATSQVNSDKVFEPSTTPFETDTCLTITDTTCQSQKLPGLRKAAPSSYHPYHSAEE